jgi:hypothetical protein
MSTSRNPTSHLTSILSSSCNATQNLPPQNNNIEPTSHHTQAETPLALQPDQTEIHNLDKLALMGKLLAQKEINQNKVTNIIQKAWKSTRGLSIASIKPNIYLFKFTSEADKLKILNTSPWNIDGHHLILKHWTSDFLTNQQHFYTTSF